MRSAAHRPTSTLRGAAVVAVAVFVLVSCSSNDRSISADSPDGEVGEERTAVLAQVPATTLTGSMSDRIDQSSAEAVAARFADAWAADDFLTVAQLFSSDANRVIGRSVGNLSLADIARPGRFLDPLMFEDFHVSSSMWTADLLQAIDQQGLTPIDLHRTRESATRTNDEPIVRLAFASGVDVLVTTIQEDGLWWVSALAEDGATEVGDLYSMIDPAAGRDFVWCGADEPVVLPGVDCERVQAGTAGLTEAEQTEVASLRTAAIDDPSQALLLTQRLQALLASAPGQVCRLMQKGLVPAGDAQVRAAELEASTCPTFAALQNTSPDRSGWRYGELDLSTAEAAARTMQDAFARGDWFDVWFTTSWGAQQSVNRSVQNLDVSGLVSDEAALELLGLARGGDFVPHLFEVAGVAVSLDGTIDNLVVDGSTVNLTLESGEFGLAMEQDVSDGSWRVRAVAQGPVDPYGPFFQP